MNRKIDFKPATHQLSDVLFDVKFQNIYTNFKNQETSGEQQVGTSNYKALVNQDNGRLISVVGNKYNLIKNREALNMGKQLFHEIYLGVKTEELIPYKVIAPKTKSSVHIDLIHKNVYFNVWEQETWLPFLRGSNSYNRTHALSFEIGFVRKLCSNGMLFNKDTMKLKYIHNKSRKFEFQTDAKKVAAFTEQFKQQCRMLNEYEIEKELLFALVCHVLRINLDLPQEEKGWHVKLKQLDKLQTATAKLMSQYTNGNRISAYTTLNVATDIISHQEEYKSLTGFLFNVRGYFTRPADWIQDFVQAIKKPEFTLHEYLHPTMENLKTIEMETGFEWRLN